MQDRYVGDIGDFGKFGLLRWLSGKPELEDDDPDSPAGKLRLGVLWYLTEPEGREKSNSDGKKTEYLSRTKRESFRSCDAYLYNKLYDLVNVRKSRTVQTVRQKRILSCNWNHYYEKSLSYANNQSRPCRERRRKRWLVNALEVAKKSQMVFVDPDNGIACNCASPFIKSGPKYVYMDDLRLLVAKGKSLVIYHHLTRRHGTADEEVQHFSHCLEKKLGLPVYALKYHRGGTRFFFIVAQIEHNIIILERLLNFLGSSWCAGPDPHFTWA